MRVKDLTAILQLNARTNEAGISTRASPLENPSNNPFSQKRSVLHWKEELEKRHRPKFDTPRQSKRNKPPPLPPRYLVVSVWRSILEFIIVPVMLYC